MEVIEEEEELVVVEEEEDDEANLLSRSVSSFEKILARAAA